MAACVNCGTKFSFGGVKADGQTFCNDSCADVYRNVISRLNISDAEVDLLVKQIHRGECPKCKGPGPIDVRTSYRVWSLLIVTQWETEPEVCCRSCGLKAWMGNTALSGFLGWWGIPWGVIMTPIQLTRNFIALLQRPDPEKPSLELHRIARRMVIDRALEREQPAAQQV